MTYKYGSLCLKKTNQYYADMANRHRSSLKKMEETKRKLPDGPFKDDYNRQIESYRNLQEKLDAVNDPKAQKESLKKAYKKIRKNDSKKLIIKLCCLFIILVVTLTIKEYVQ